QSYMLAIILLIIFSVELRLFPLGGAFSLGVNAGMNLPFVISVMRHLTLPILTFYLLLFPGWMFGTRSIATSVMKEDYILTAKARGIHGNRMTMSYVGKNSLLPQFTSLLFSYGLLFGGSIFIESIFNIPGLGYVLTTSTGARDYPLVIGAFIIIIVAVIAGNFIADIGYGLIDPRVRSR
ncbi:MAG: ABC transporter permease, partial [Thermoprotei archaeon]